MQIEKQLPSSQKTRSDSESLDEQKIVIVMPTLNEEKAIGLLIERIKVAMWAHDYKVLVVDGHSMDGTVDLAKENGALVTYQSSVGYGDALKCGFDYALTKLKADIVVMMDADGTYDPADIPRLLQPIFEGNADLVIGNRFLRMKKEAMTLKNRIGNKVISWVARRILKVDVKDTQCGLRAVRANIFDYFDLKSSGMPLAIEMIAEAKQVEARISEVPIIYGLRLGKTKLNPMRDGLRILGVTLRLARDYEPLLLFGTLGFLLGAIGVSIGMTVLIEWIITGSILHLASVSLSSLLIIAGLQIFVIGVIADMIKGVKEYQRKNLRRYGNNISE